MPRCALPQLLSEAASLPRLYSPSTGILNSMTRLLWSLFAYGIRDVKVSLSRRWLFLRRVLIATVQEPDFAILVSLKWCRPG